MKILFCGISVPEKIEYQVEQISAAGNRFQNNMIQNLRAMGHEVTTMSYIAVHIPPEVSATLCETKEQYYVLRENTGVKGIWEAVKACRKTVKKLLPDYDMVIAYNVFYSYLFLPQLVKKYGKKSVLILADYSGKECYTSVLGKLYATCQHSVMKKYDTVVGLSANIRSALKETQKFVLMEGGISQSFYDKFVYKQRNENAPVRFMYSGLLSKVTGVDILLEAIEALKDEKLELWISGKGDLENLVKKAVQNDDRIQFLGHMEYEEYMEKLQQADVLINPRNMTLPENQNNFPSKIMEYLAVGKPIISSKFVGWEKFQDEIWFYEKDLTTAILEMKQQIEKKSEWTKSQYECSRKRAREYLWVEQLKKIL